MKNILLLKVRRRFKKRLCDRNLLLQSPSIFYPECFIWALLWLVWGFFLGRIFLVVCFGFFLMWLEGGRGQWQCKQWPNLIHSSYTGDQLPLSEAGNLILLVDSQQILQNATKALCSALQNAHQVLSSKGIAHRTKIIPAAGLAAVQSDYFCLGK